VAPLIKESDERWASVARLLLSLPTGWWRKFPLAAQHGANHLQTQIGGDLRGCVADLPLCQQQQQAFDRSASDNDHQQHADAGADTHIVQHTCDGTFEFILAGRGTTLGRALHGDIHQRQQR